MTCTTVERAGHASLILPQIGVVWCDSWTRTVRAIWWAQHVSRWMWLWTAFSSIHFDKKWKEKLHGHYSCSYYRWRRTGAYTGNLTVCYPYIWQLSKCQFYGATYVVITYETAITIILPFQVTWHENSFCPRGDGFERHVKTPWSPALSPTPRPDAPPACLSVSLAARLSVSLAPFFNNYVVTPK